jgi:hypothetical protein
MVRQNGKIGLDEDWEKSGIIPFKSENSATVLSIVKTDVSKINVA